MVHIFGSYNVNCSDAIICMGGSLGMYCYQCGKQVFSNMAFCPSCGAKLINPSVNQEQKKTVLALTPAELEPQSIDHKALEIYLRDLLNLEYIQRKLTRKLNDIANAAKRYKTQEYEKEYVIGHILHPTRDINDINNRSDFFVFKRQNNTVLVRCINWDGYTIPVSCRNDWNVYCDHFYCQLDGNMSHFRKEKTWELFLRAHFCKPGFLQKNRLINQFIAEFEKDYSDFSGISAVELENKKKQYIIFQNQFNDIHSTDYKKVKALLKEAYDINIIPSPFRNLHAIQYLYDFIKTSGESLQTAMLHADLNEIKKKLDKIIQQQEEIIINQSIMMAQNRSLLQSNQEYLKKLDGMGKSLSSIKESANSTSVYASIAANNAKAAAFISLANYIK